jgi:hypothetical protein
MIEVIENPVITRQRDVSSRLLLNGETEIIPENNTEQYSNTIDFSKIIKPPEGVAMSFKDRGGYGILKGKIHYEGDIFNLANTLAECDDIY